MSSLINMNGSAGILSPPEDPQTWMDYLAAKLGANIGAFRKFSDYYEGSHQRMLFSQARYKSHFAKVFENLSDNFCSLIVDSVNERLVVEGFRLSDDPSKDGLARDVWQRNHMDVESNIAHLDAMIQGSSYAVVWGDDGGRSTRATVCVESPQNVVVQYKPGSRRDVEAAGKFYTDDWGRNFATLWWRDRVYTADWKVGGYSIDRSEPNPLGRPPVVPVHNRCRSSGDPTSDLAVIIPIQDAINKIVSDSLITSEAAAFPQKFVTGIEIREDEHGRPVEPFSVAVDKILQAEDPAASFGQFTAADLANYVHLVDMFVQHLAAISRIPFHYLLKGGQPPSGDAMTSAEAGLVSKCRERMLHFGGAWEQVVQLAMEVEGRGGPDAFPGVETVWSNPENFTEAQHVDALIKLKQLDVPVQQLWVDAGYTQSQIDRFSALLEEHDKASQERAQRFGLPGQQPQPQPQSDGVVEVKPPQGNSGNANRDRFELSKKK